MEGQIKVIGANELLEEYKDLEDSGSLLSIDEAHYDLKIGEETFYYQIYKNVIAEDSIEFEGWAATKDEKVGRLGIKFTPKTLANLKKDK
jgi:hypothetical protein